MKNKKTATGLGLISLIVLGIVAYFAARSLESIKNLDMSDPFEVDFDDSN